MSKSIIRAAVQRGEIVRVRKGWYAEPRQDEPLVRAARVGGRLTCASALKRKGYWVLDDGRLHVSVTGDRTQLRSSRDPQQRIDRDRSRVRIHWSGGHGDSFVVDPLTALVHYSRCASPELFAATAESVMHLTPSLEPLVRALTGSIPRSHRATLAAIDGRSESGIETLFRLRIRSVIHLAMRSQVSMPGVGDVDFVLGRRLVVEVDGRQFHDTPDQFEKDRARDAALSAQGFRVLRFSYRQIMSAWPTVERAVIGAIERGDAW